MPPSSVCGERSLHGSQRQLLPSGYTKFRQPASVRMGENEADTRADHHCNNTGRSIWNDTAGFRIILRVELPCIESLSVTIFPSVNAPAPAPPCMVRHVVLVPQVDPLP